MQLISQSGQGEALQSGQGEALQTIALYKYMVHYETSWYVYVNTNWLNSLPSTMLI